MSNVAEYIRTGLIQRLQLGLGAVLLASMHLLAGCQCTQGLGDRFDGSAVYGLYATYADAMAVALGQYGAAPGAFVTQAEMVASGSALSRSVGVAEILVSGTRRGWISLDDLPPLLKGKAMAIPEASASSLRPWSSAPVQR